MDGYILLMADLNKVNMQLTYFGSLIIFLAPPILLLLFSSWREIGGKPAKTRKNEPWNPFLFLFSLIIIAITYTTPWDNFLVATGVWWYDIELVSGLLIGYVPLEEYLFFILQTLLTGLIVLAIWNLQEQKIRETISNNRTHYWIALIIAILWAVSAYLLVFGSHSLNYLTLILTWALIPIIIQVAFGGDILWAHRKSLFLAVTIPTLYLWLMDAISINAGIWTIDPQQTIGLGIGNLPIEEMMFFLMTNVLVSFGMTLLLSPFSKARIKSFITILYRTANMGPFETKDV